MRKSLTVLGALALAGATQATAQMPIVKWRTSPAPEARGDALLRTTMLSAHNAARAQAGVAPLTWNAALAEDAAHYARALAWSGSFQHSAVPRGAPVQGENLWMGTRNAFRLDEMVGAWTEERRFFRNAPTPYFASNGRWEDVGHYTQMIWGQTREVGCALAAGHDDDYLVCRYLPAGNVMGEGVFQTDEPPARYAMRGR